MMIYISIHTRGGWSHSSVTNAVIAMLQDQRYVVRHKFPELTPYVNSLHTCMQAAIESNADYWLTIDDDNPPLRNPLDLVELNCDIIGFPTPIWCPSELGVRPWSWNVMDRDEEVDGWRPHVPSQPPQLEEVDAVGSGCMLVARRVLDAMRYEQPFARTWNSDGTVRDGADFSFCRRAKAAGFKVHTHFGYPCRHFKQVDLYEMIEHFNAQKNLQHQS